MPRTLVLALARAIAPSCGHPNALARSWVRSMLALSLFSTLHLGLAMVVAFMAVIHLGMWLALRTERANLWVGLSFAGFAVLDAVLAATSVSGGGELGATGPWLLMTVATALLLPHALLRCVWAVLDLPMGRVRWGVALTTFVLVLPEAINVVRLVATDHPSAATWEASRYDFPWAAVPYQLALGTVGMVWLIESLRCLKSVPTVARLALAGLVPALVIQLRESLLFWGVVDGPTWVGLTGMPLAMFASGGLIARHVMIVRAAVEPTGVKARYRRVYQLGRGGMGEVWLGVRHGAGGFRRFVVLKRIRLDGQSHEAMVRFVAEARVAARLHHPNIVAVHDFGRFDAGTGEGGWVIVMEYLPGASLYDVLHRAYEEQTAVPPEVIVTLGEQILRGLDCAHSHGVLHRDISPDNVIVTFDGAVKLLDFGIAKDTRHGLTAPVEHGPFPEGGFMTVPGGVAGKRRYLAPERLIGEEAVVESDIYSLALVLLELFGVELKPSGGDMANTQTPLADSGLAAPEGLEAVLARALSAHPKQRFRSAAAMAAALRTVGEGLPAVDLGMWSRGLCPKRYEIARRLAELDSPQASSVEAVFAQAVPPTVEVSPARPGERPGLAEQLADRLVAVGPQLSKGPVPDRPGEMAIDTPGQPPRQRTTPD